LVYEHLRPELNDHALILVLNAFKDGLRPTPWALEDLRRIVRHEQFSGEVLVYRAREGCITSALWLVADWMAEEHHAEEWREVRDRIGPCPPSERVQRVYGVWRRHGQPAKPGLFVTASSGDGAWRCSTGLVQAAAGVIRGQALRLLEAAGARRS
jgi:hypothetical protein